MYLQNCALESGSFEGVFGFYFWFDLVCFRGGESGFWNEPLWGLLWILEVRIVVQCVERKRGVVGLGDLVSYDTLVFLRVGSS